MKKLLFVLMCTSLPAFASSNVTLYGRIDASAVVGKVKGQDTTIQEQSGFTSGSRYGIQGVEDLGNSYKVGFILENGFSVDDGVAGSAGSAFNREASLFIQGGFGKLIFGRLGTLGFAQSTGIRTGWVFGVTHGGSKLTSTLKQSMGRVNNGIAYQTPGYKGFSLHAMYSNGISEDESKWSDNDHYYGVGIRYSGSELKGSLIFESRDYKSSTKKQDNWNLLTFGAQYKTKYVTPMFFYQYSWQNNNFRQHTIALSGKSPLAGGDISLGVKYVFAKADGKGTYVKTNDHDKAGILNIGAKYDYPLSKRSSVYAYAGYNTVSKAWNTDAKLSSDNGYLYAGWQTAVGLLHLF